MILNKLCKKINLKFSVELKSSINSSASINSILVTTKMSNKNVKEVEGECCRDANAILELSQGAPSQTQWGNATGHPRYHVLCKPGIENIELLSDLDSLTCTEAISSVQGSNKTAFLNKDDQNRVLHEILSSPKGKEALRQLNSGQNEVTLNVPVQELNENRDLKMAVVEKGVKTGIERANNTVLILGHHQKNPEGTYVHVKTFYPTS